MTVDQYNDCLMAIHFCAQSTAAEAERQLFALASWGASR